MKEQVNHGVKFFKIDHGNWFSVINEFALHNIYVKQVDHKEYPTFDDWIWDMKRCGIVTYLA